MATTVQPKGKKAVYPGRKASFAQIRRKKAPIRGETGMSRPATIRKIGNSRGVIFPEEVLNKLNVEAGNQVFFVNTPNGIEVTAYDPDFAEAIKRTRRHMRQYRDVFKELAKG